MIIDVNELFNELGHLPQVKQLHWEVQEQLDEMIPNRTTMCMYI